MFALVPGRVSALCIVLATCQCHDSRVSPQSQGGALDCTQPGCGPVSCVALCPLTSELFDHACVCSDGSCVTAALIPVRMRGKSGLFGVCHIRQSEVFMAGLNYNSHWTDALKFDPRMAWSHHSCQFSVRGATRRAAGRGPPGLWRVRAETV